MYLQIYLDNCAYKFVNTEFVDYIDDKFSETDCFFSFMNIVLQ